MRLRELFTEARSAMDPFQGLKGTSNPLPGGGPGMAVENVAAFVGALDTLLALPLGSAIQNQLKSLRELPICQQAAATVLVSEQEWSSIRQRVTTTTNMLSGTLDAIRAVLGTSAPEHAINIRLPPLDGGGIDAMCATLEEFSKAIERPVRRLLQAELRVVGVDRGSAWLEIVSVGGPAVVTCVKLLVETWQGYLEHKARIRRLEAEAEMLNAGQDVLRNLADARETMQAKWVRQEADKIVVRVVPQEDHPLRSDMELRRDLENSIKVGARLLQRGAAVDVRRLEPGIAQAAGAKVLEAPESASLLQLEDGNDDSSDSGSSGPST